MTKPFRRTQNKTSEIRIDISKKAKWTYRIIEFVCFAFGLLGMFACLEISEMGKTINGEPLFIILGFIGLVFAFLIINLLLKRVPLFSVKPSVFILGGLLAGFCFTIPALASYYNRTHITSEWRCNEFKVFRKGENYLPRQNSSTHYLAINFNGKEKTFSTKKITWDNTLEGGFVKLCVVRGGLGLDFVKEIYYK